MFHVRSRRDLVLALNHDVLLLDHFLPKVDFRKGHLLDQRPKIIYVHGTIDLNVDHKNRPLKEEDYMRTCSERRGGEALGS